MLTRMEWDIWADQLTLLPQDTITQERPAIAVRSGEGAWVVWVGSARRIGWRRYR
jgi:hypothetical protein